MTDRRSVSGLGVLSLLWGAGWLLLPNPGLGSLSTIRVSAAQAALAAVLLLPWAVPQRKRLSRFWRTNLLLGCTSIAGPQLLEAWKPSGISPGLALAILGLAPLLTALVEGTLALWSAPALGGVAGICALSAGSFSFAVGQWPSALALLAASMLIAFSLLTANRRLQSAPLAGSACLQMLTSAVVLGSINALAAPTRHALRGARGAGSLFRALTGADLAYVLISAALAAAAATLLLWLLQRLSPVQAGSALWLQVVWALSGSALMLHQRPGWLMVLGGALILASTVALLRTDSAEQSPLLLEIT